MTNIAAVYFSNNELHCLDVSYGISSLKKIDCSLSVHNIDDNNIIFELNKINSTKNVVVIFLSYNCYELLLKVCIIIKMDCPNTIIIICNSLATELSEILLRNISCIDISIIGEYEQTLLNVCRLIDQNQDFKTCKGIAYLENGRYIQNPLMSLSNIEDIAYPAREYFPTDTRFFHMYGSRGCEGHCTFCDRNSVFKNDANICLRERDIEDIVKEIDMLVYQYNCKFISFSDPTFCSSLDAVDRLTKLYEYLVIKNYWIQFSFNMRAELISNDVIDCFNQLKKVGLGKVFIGIESFNESDLKLYRKLSTAQVMINSISMLKKLDSKYRNNYKLKIEYGFINFNPYSTIENLSNNLRCLKYNDIKLNPYIISSKLTLNILTKLSSKVNRDGLFIKDLHKRSIDELLDYSFEYYFKDKGVEKLYSSVIYICNKLNVHNDNGLEFIRNRYFHFFGYDEVIQRYDKTYFDWVELVSQYSYQIYEELFLIHCYHKSKELCNYLCDEFIQKYNEIDKRLKTIQQRALIRLGKIDELIYYRAVFN